jgi:hypothetical protein
MMLISTFLDRIGQFISRLYGRQWALWEILATAVVALAVLLWIVSRQRARKLRKISEGHYLENSPVIGVNLGSPKRRRFLIGDLKKSGRASNHKHQQHQHLTTKKPLEKLHEEIKQLQCEIIKQKQVEAHLEQQISELKAENEKLQQELTESRQAEQQIAENPVAEEQLQPEASQVKQDEQNGQVKQEDEVEQSEQVEQVEQTSEQKVMPEPAVEAPVTRKSARKIKDYEKSHRIAGGVKQKLCRKCKEWRAESEFHKNSASKDGLAGACKACKTNAAREYRKRRKASKE